MERPLIYEQFYFGKFLLFIFLDEKLFYFLLKETLMEENDMPWVTCFYPLFSINA
jgi:hypothetical protein